MVSRRFWVEFFRSLRCRIMLSASKDILTISFSICIPFVSSSYLIVLSRNSSTMFNRSRESGHPCLIPVYGEMVSVFFHSV
jgi:hypothetical protein